MQNDDYISFWILTILGGMTIVCMVVIYTLSYLQNRKLHNPTFLTILSCIGFALISTPHWSKMQIGTPKHGITLSREQEQEIEGMDTFVYIYKPRVEELPTEKYDTLITKMNNFDTLLQNFHKTSDEQGRAKMYEKLRKGYVGTSTNVLKALRDDKDNNLTIKIE